MKVCCSKAIGEDGRWNDINGTKRTFYDVIKIGGKGNIMLRRMGFTRRIRMTIGLSLCLVSMAWPTAHGAKPMEVFVSIVPQKTFVEKLGGDLVKVSVMVQPGANPATYEPKPRQMTALSKAKAYFTIGVPFETVWLDRISAANSGMTVIHTEDGIEKRVMEDHYHGEKGPLDHEDKEHEQGRGNRRVKDPHIWLSPPLVKIQARNILDGLLRIDPPHGASYKSGYKEFIAELNALDTKIKGIFAGKGKGMEFIVFHPAWGYFADAYGLKQVAVEIEGKEPGPADLRELIRHAREKGIKVVFVQPEFSTKSAETIAKAIEGQVLFADPLAPDWGRNLEEMAVKFKAALR
jgi:zinc transport system substrate-binding protein